MTKHEKMVFGSFALLLLGLFITNMIIEKSILDLFYLIVLICSIIRIKKLA